MEKFNNPVSLTVKFYCDDKYDHEITFDALYIAAIVIRSWIHEDGWSVECKGIRLYKDCKLAASEKCVKEFIDKVK